MENKKIMVVIVPYWGHVNPILGLVKEMVDRKANVQFFNNLELKDPIEKTGATFRELPYFPKMNMSYFADPTQNPKIIGAKYFIDIGLNSLAEFTRVVEEENIDLIIYDQFSFAIKYLMNHLNHKYKNGLSKRAPPPAIIFSPCFVYEENVFPITEADTKYAMFNFDDELNKDVDILDEEQAEINKKYQMDVGKFYRFFTTNMEKMVIVPVIKELQPRGENFSKTFNFVGPCFAKGREETINNPKLKDLLSSFKPINPLRDFSEKHNEKGLRLVYVSLGTVFNENTFVFETIIQALKTFDDEEEDKKSDVNLSQLRVVFAVGSVSEKALTEKIENGTLALPNNFLIVDNAPQLEVLKRASVFLSHCGMNSTSEAVHYGVPLVCLPVTTDQPLNAFRLSDELKLAKRFDLTKLSADEIRAEVHEVFKNRERFERILEFARTSQSYNGIQDSANLVDNYIKQNNAS